MTLPKNKNIRKIHVNEESYYWVAKCDKDNGQFLCNVGLIENPNIRFSFTLGADDVHLEYIQSEITEDVVIRSVTPKIIRKSILYANEHLDWRHRKHTVLPYETKWFKD